MPHHIANLLGLTPPSRTLHLHCASCFMVSFASDLPSPVPPPFGAYFSRWAWSAFLSFLVFYFFSWVVPGVPAVFDLSRNSHCIPFFHWFPIAFARHDPFRTSDPRICGGSSSTTTTLRFSGPCRSFVFAPACSTLFPSVYLCPQAHCLSPWISRFRWSVPLSHDSCCQVHLLVLVGMCLHLWWPTPLLWQFSAYRYGHLLPRARPLLPLLLLTTGFAVFIFRWSLPLLFRHLAQFGGLYPRPYFLDMRSVLSPSLSSLQPIAFLGISSSLSLALRQSRLSLTAFAPLSLALDTVPVFHRGLSLLCIAIPR